MKKHTVMTIIFILCSCDSGSVVNQIVAGTTVAGTTIDASSGTSAAVEAAEYKPEKSPFKTDNSGPYLNGTILAQVSDNSSSTASGTLNSSNSLRVAYEESKIIHKGGQIIWTEEQSIKSVKEQQDLRYASVVYEQLSGIRLPEGAKIVVREDKENVAVFFSTSARRLIYDENHL